MNVVSKLRVEYWIESVFTYLLGFGVAYLSIYFLFYFEVASFWFWVGIISLILGILYLWSLILTAVWQLTISDSGITIIYLIPKKIRVIKFNEIKNLKVLQIPHSNVSSYSGSYELIEIESITDIFITIGETKFSNYREIKGSIYSGRNNAE